ncbi:MAG: hypothetical protein HUU22_03560 [Phycisphaerae bacterium]|nr:hypothetical protein [Phycisphaerae bacterium]NUQ45093.1 hypothetical protein [Phycisphaerae bacterium]
MEFKRIIVLANSYKKTPGRCVAGRELAVDHTVGAWLRPISELPEGELLPSHMKTADRSRIDVLDVIDVPVFAHAGDTIHPEDWRIDTSAQCVRRGRHPINRLRALAESPHELWMDPATRPDRATPNFLARRLHQQSLYLIRPSDFRVELRNEFNPFEGRNQQKRRACFTYREQQYSLGLTDPVFIQKYATRFPGPNRPAIIVRPRRGDDCLLCVSLTPIFNGYHYKVVATVLELS